MPLLHSTFGGDKAFGRRRGAARARGDDRADAAMVEARHNLKSAATAHHSFAERMLRPKTDVMQHRLCTFDRGRQFPVSS